MQPESCYFYLEHEDVYCSTTVMFSHYECSGYPREDKYIVRKTNHSACKPVGWKLVAHQYLYDLKKSGRHEDIETVIQLIIEHNDGTKSKCELACVLNFSLKEVVLQDCDYDWDHDFIYHF